MSERYYITGAQIGIIRANLSRGIISINDLLDEIEDNQFIGNVPFKGKYKIVIKESK